MGPQHIGQPWDAVNGRKWTSYIPGESILGSWTTYTKLVNTTPTWAMYIEKVDYDVGWFILDNSESHIRMIAWLNKWEYKQKVMQQYNWLEMRHPGRTQNAVFFDGSVQRIPEKAFHAAADQGGAQFMKYLR